jgi:phosphoenolpyruvate synthase/pyruvate phosphate dikinase
MLQTRTGKRTAEAAVKIAVDMVIEGLITKEDAVARIEPQQIDHLLHRRFDAAGRKFLVDYVKKGILGKNPFQSLDVDGVGQMIITAVKREIQAGL